MSAVERVWYGEGWRERVARTLLAPAAWGYGAVIASRNALYDRGILRAHAPALPVLSLGNLSVGGTGKTPIAAWAAARLRAAGARPAIVLRGYGVKPNRTRSVTAKPAAGPDPGVSGRAGRAA